MCKTAQKLILIALLAFTTGCTEPSASDGQRKSDPDNTQNASPLSLTSEQPTSIAIITPSQPPTPTITPFYEIHDMESWPSEMQAYFMRAPQEWNKTSRQYSSDTEFQDFITSARRHFLAEQLSTDLSTFSDHELLMNYIQWGNQNKKIIILTPLEIRDMLSENRSFLASYSVIVDNTLTFHEGLFTLNKLRTDLDFESLVNQLAEQSFSINVFGEHILIPRKEYYGFAGDEAGLFRIPGISPEEGIGLLGHWNPESGEHAWLPLVVHFSPHVYSEGDVGIFNANIVEYEEESTMGPAHTGPLGNEGQLVTLDYLLTNIGQKIQASADHSWVGDFSGNFPWQLGIEGAQRLEFDQSPLIFPPIVYPWD